MLNYFVIPGLEHKKPLNIKQLHNEQKLVMILSALKQASGFEKQSLVDKTRVAEIRDPRHIFFYLAKKHTNLSLNSIGEYLGGRNHATVLHSVRHVEAQIRLKQPLGQYLSEVESKLTFN
jgi:chromosomal replication initiator protein